MKLPRWLAIPPLLLAVFIAMEPSPPMRPGTTVSIVALIIGLFLTLPALLAFRKAKIFRLVPILLSTLFLFLLVLDVRTALDPYREYRGRIGIMRLVAQGKQLALAAEAAGYPGDLPISTEKEYVEYLVKNDFLSERDLKILSGPG